MSTLAIAGVLMSIHVQQKNYIRQQFESNLYALLTNWRLAREDVFLLVYDISGDPIMKYKPTYHKLKRSLRPIKERFEGDDAIAMFLWRLRDEILKNGFNDAKTVARAYRKLVYPSRTIGNYFRILYHIYNMLDEADIGNKRFYARIIRAHITDVELCLIAYNCAVDEGRHKFKKLVEKYSILHNLKIENLDDVEEAELNFFLDMFNDDAFRFETPCKFGYDSGRKITRTLT